MEAERGQDQNTLSFKARSETFGQKGEETIHAALSALAKRTVWVTSVMREPLKNSGQRVSNLLELALEAEGRKGLGLQETMVWLEFLYGQGLIRWPQAAGELFGPVGPKPIEQSPAGWRQTDQKSVAPDIDSAGCGFSCLSDEKPAFLEAPARLILEMIREGRDWERPIQSGEGLFLEKVILESEDSLNIYKAVLGPFVCGGGSGLSQGETLRVKGGRILLDWDPSPIPYTPASLAKDFCRPVPASLREFNVGLRELAKKKCFKYFQGALMPSELGRRCDRLLRNLSFSDPGYLRAIWERIWRAANSPGEAETKVLAILRKEENLAWTEAERLLVDKFSLTKLMMNESERPKERPDPKAKWDRPTFFA
jgi:hypothetical protein